MLHRNVQKKRRGERVRFRDEDRSSLQEAKPPGDVSPANHVCLGVSASSPMVHSIGVRVDTTSRRVCVEICINVLVNGVIIKSLLQGSNSAASMLCG